MNSRFWWASAAIILVALPATAIGIGLALFDPNDYKPQIAAAVQNATGRTISLNGPLRISRSLWPTIEVSDVTLSNLPGGTRPDMARAERIEAELSLPALLQHRIEVAKLTLIGPNILFEQVGGKPNWVFTPPPDADTAAGPAPHSAFSLRIRQAHVQNGMVTSHLPARTQVVGIRSLDLAHQTDGGPLDLAGVLVYADNQPFGLRATAQPTDGLKGPWTTQLDFTAFDTTASAKGTMDVAGAYDLQIEATSGAVEKLNALLPEMRLPALHQATLSAHVTNGAVPGDLPVIGAATLHVGSADLRDRIANLTLGATDLSLPKPGGTATLSGTGRYATQPFTLNTSITVPTKPDGRVTLPIEVKAQATPGNGSLSAKGRLTLDKLQFAGLDTTADLRVPALAALQPLVTPHLPALTDVRIAGQFTVPANLGSVGFKAATLDTAAGDVSGDGTLVLNSSPSLDARLQSKRLDADAMLAAFGVDIPPLAAHGRAEGIVIPDTPLPWAMLRGPRLDLSGSVGALTIAKQVWPNVALALKLDGGRLQLGPATLGLPQGPLTLSVTADAATDQVPVSLALHAPAIPLALAAHYAGLPGSVAGTMRLDSQLHATGRSAHELAASLDGSLAATAIGGRLSNAAFIELTSAALKALDIEVPAQGETALRCFGIDGTFNKGIGRFKTIALDTTYLQLDGAGQIDLGQENVAFKLNPLVHLSGSSVSVPVLVEGPFRAITGRLDADGLDKVGLLIDAWFGGDHPETCSDAGLVPASK